MANILVSGKCIWEHSTRELEFQRAFCFFGHIIAFGLGIVGTVWQIDTQSSFRQNFLAVFFTSNRLYLVESFDILAAAHSNPLLPLLSPSTVVGSSGFRVSCAFFSLSSFQYFHLLHWAGEQGWLVLVHGKWEKAPEISPLRHQKISPLRHQILRPHLHAVVRN